jgi:hypothetical protein
MRGSKILASIDSKRDMITSLFTDKERILPLVHSREKILNDTKERIEDLCSTSKVHVKKDKDT